MQHEVALRAQIVDLTSRLHKAEDRVFQLEEMLGLGSEGELALIGLSPQQAVIVGMLRRRALVPTSVALDALYMDRPDAAAEVDRHVIYVIMSHTRKKLRRIGVNVLTVGHTGWKMPDEDKKRLSDALAEARACIHK